jgi:putative transposase
VVAESRGLTEAVRIVTSVAREVQVSAGGAHGLGCHVVWCPKYRCQVLAGWAAGSCEGPTRAKAVEDGWRIAVLEIMPDHVHLFVKAHRSDSPSGGVGQFKGFTSRWLRAGLPHLQCRLPALWSWSYFTATAGAVSAETVCRYTGPQDGRPWRKERAW